AASLTGRRTLCRSSPAHRMPRVSSGQPLPGRSPILPPGVDPMTPSQTVVRTPVGEPARDAARPAEPCTLVIFGASGHLPKSLPIPAPFSLAGDGLPADRLGIIGIAWDKLTTDEFRARMSEDIRKFNTRTQFDARVWDNLAARLHYTPGDFGDPKSYQTLGELIARVAAERQTGGNLLLY